MWDASISWAQDNPLLLLNATYLQLGREGNAEGVPIRRFCIYGSLEPVLTKIPTRHYILLLPKEQPEYLGSWVAIF